MPCRLVVLRFTRIFCAGLALGLLEKEDRPAYAAAKSYEALQVICRSQLCSDVERLA